LTVTEAAERLGVIRQALNNVVNEKAGISPEMSIRIFEAFGSSPKLWLGL
jgi:antitoxin HigA-1